MGIAAMPASIGVNLRVTGHCSQGGRRYMEDLFSVAYQQTEDERDLEYAFFGIYDGHGGGEAAAFAKEHLMDIIVKQRGFWSDNDEDVLRAIRNGYMITHLNMWKDLEKWPKTVAGLPSTAGTTASVAFIRRGKIYIGHVGDSAIVLGYQQDGASDWLAKPLTLDHKPESRSEMERIQQSGGKVVAKAGVPRVVWNRPRLGHKGPINETTPVDEIPFLAVARSLGDLWSYNGNTDEFIVSPDPDVGVLPIDTSKFRCLIFGTDGLWNMMSPLEAVHIVQATERHNEAAVVALDNIGVQARDWRNPSKILVDNALQRWSSTRMRADNTSVVTLMLDPPGPPRAAVLRSRTAARQAVAPPHADRPLPQNGLTIVTRYSEEEKSADKTPLPPCASLDSRFSLGTASPPPPAPPAHAPAEHVSYGDPAGSCYVSRVLSRHAVTNTLQDVFAARAASPPAPPVLAPPERQPVGGDESIQINEVSSSSPTEAPPRPRGRRPREAVAPAAPAARPATRLNPVRVKPEQAAPPHRVEILRRRPLAPVETPPACSPSVAAAPEPKQVLRRTESEPAQDPRIKREVIVRVTRSKDAVPVPPTKPAQKSQAGKETRSGNGARAPGPRRSVASPAARGQSGPPARAAPGPPRAASGLPARERSETPDAKENVARRAGARGRGPRRRCREPAEAEVHSTTSDGVADKPRALRSRNQPEAPPAKRARPPDRLERGYRRPRHLTRLRKRPPK